MFRVTLRFYEELNDFIRREQRKQAYTVVFAEPRSVKDLVESEGVPHTEVDLILANGESVGFDYQVRDGDRISVYPVFESLDVSGISRLGRPPLRQCRFIADVHVKALVRRLRFLGFDCLYDPSWDDAELAWRSATGGRILLTRDRGLLKRAIVTHGICLHSDRPDEQLREVVARLDLARQLHPFSRCSLCNGRLRSVPAEQVRDAVPARTYAHVHTYFQCDCCGKVFWKGTHWPRLQQILRSLTSGARRPADGARGAASGESMGKRV